MPPTNPRRPRAGATPAAAKAVSSAAPKAAAKPATAKKPAAKRAWDTGSDYSRSFSNFWEDTQTDAEARNGGTLVGREAERAVIGIPLRALSLQYLYSSDIYPLGRMEMLIGESDSCKTAFLFEQERWFLRMPGAGAVYELNEARDPSVLRTSIVGPELLNDGRFRLEGPCESLEHWQRNITGILHRFEDKFKVSGGAAFPLHLGLDSITGTTNERVIKGIDEVGCATLTFGQDANLLNMYSKYLFQRLYKWPISFTTTSHIKYTSDKFNNKAMKIPGGDALRYVSTYITHLTKLKDIDRLEVTGGRRLRLKTIKSMGEHRTLEVDFVWVIENSEQRSTWNWHGATAELLFGFTGDRRKQIDEIVNFPIVNKTSQTCSCPAVGIRKAAPYDEVGAAIMEDANIVHALQDYFGIQRRRAFEAGVPYNEQIAAAIAAGDIVRHDHGDVAGVDKSTEDEAINEDAPDVVPVEE